MKFFKSLKNAVLALGIVIFAVLSLIYIDNVKAAILSSLKSCVYTIMPSLFVMCVLSGWIIMSGVFDRIFIRLGINSAALTAFFLGNIGGYPIGAKTVSGLISSGRLTQSEAENVICFSFASGPAFCLGIVSAAVFNSKTLGFISFLSVFLSNLTLYLIYSVGHRHKSKEIYIQENSFSYIMTQSVQSATSAMITICSSILFFSAVIAILCSAFPILLKLSWLPSILEISNIVNNKCSGALSFAASSALLSFGGICVHFQVSSLTGDSFSLKKFYLTRPLQIGLTALYSFIIYKLFLTYLPASILPKHIIVTQSDSLIPFICITAMLIISMTYRNKNKKSTRQKLDGFNRVN